MRYIENNTIVAPAVWWPSWREHSGPAPSGGTWSDVWLSQVPWSSERWPGNAWCQADQEKKKRGKNTCICYIENGLNCIVKYDPLTLKKEVYDKPKLGLDFEILNKWLFHVWFYYCNTWKRIVWVFPITYIIISQIHQPTTVNVQCYIPPSMPDGKCGTWRVKCYRRKN